MQTRKRAVIDLTNEPGEVVSLAAAQAEREAQHGYLGRLPDRVLREIATYLYTCMIPSIEFIPVLAPFVGDADIQANFSLIPMIRSDPVIVFSAWAWREYCKRPNSTTIHRRLAEHEKYKGAAYLFVKKRPAGYKHWMLEFPDKPGAETIQSLLWVLVSVLARGTLSELFLVASLFAKMSNPEAWFAKQTDIESSIVFMISVATKRDNSADFCQLLFSIIKIIHANNTLDLRKIITRIIVRFHKRFRLFMTVFSHMEKELYAITLESIIQHNLHAFLNEHFYVLYPHVTMTFILDTMQRNWSWKTGINSTRSQISLMGTAVTNLSKYSNMIIPIAKMITTEDCAKAIWSIFLRPRIRETIGPFVPNLMQIPLFASTARPQATLTDFINICDDRTFPMQALIDAGYAITPEHVVDAVVRKKPEIAKKLFDRLELDHASTNQLFWLLWEHSTDACAAGFLSALIESGKLRGPQMEAKLHELYESNNSCQAALLLRALAAQNHTMEQ
jgi:hypothetical protein